eukprot:SAG31_NODE_4960_length_2834_cov_2.174040_4_plen_82_part_00
MPSTKLRLISAVCLACRDVKDHVGVDTAQLMPYWDRYDEGVFVGAKHSGSVLVRARSCPARCNVCELHAHSLSRCPLCFHY